MNRWTRLLDTPHRYLMHQNTVHLWCSGTYSWVRWGHNFDVRRSNALGRKVNTRDLEEAQAIIDELLSVIGTVETDTEFVCYGYSLGGSLAAIAALLLKDAGYEAVIKVFAPKRSMNDMSDVSINRATAARGDLVPFLPLWPLYAGWNLVWYGKLEWPWTAHTKEARAAARHRRSIEKAVQ